MDTITIKRHTRSGKRGTYTRVARKGKMLRRRPVTFQHIRTGRIISAPSIVAFVRKAGLKRVARFQFNDVLRGKKLSLHGWGLPRILNTRLRLKDVYGNRYEGTVAELRRKLSGCTIRRLLKGQPVASLALESHDYGRIVPPRAERIVGYSVVRDGRRYDGQTLEEVAGKAGVSVNAVYNLSHGLSHEVNGTTLHHVKTVRRKARIGKGGEVRLNAMTDR